MGAEVAIREEYQVDPTGGRLVAWAQAASAANQLAISLCKTDFVPKRRVNGVDVALSEGDATAMIIMGDELGFTPLAALRSIYIIHGTPALYARSMIALVLSRGHEIWTESSSDEKVEVHGRRKGSDKIEKSVWSKPRAEKAGYLKNSKYATNPQEMFYSKAAAEICRKIGADVLLGIPFSVEDLELEVENTDGDTSQKMTRTKKEPTEKVAIARKSATENAQEVEEPEFDDEPDTKADTPAVNTDDSADQSTETEDNEEPISPAQIKTIGAAMTRLGMTDRAVAIAYVGDVVEHPITSRKDLTKDEASKVIRSLLADEEALNDSAEAKANGDE